MPERGAVSQQLVLGPCGDIADFQNFGIPEHTMCIDNMRNRLTPLPSEFQIRHFATGLILDHQNPVSIKRLVQHAAGIPVDALTNF